MESRRIGDVDLLLWQHPQGMSAFAAPFVFDLEYDAQQQATIDASYSRLINYPSGIDRYRVLQGPERSAILIAALARREDFARLKGSGGYLVRQNEAGIGEAEFLDIVVRFVLTWRSQAS